jgi:hypothetical protein
MMDEYHGYRIPSSLGEWEGLAREARWASDSQVAQWHMELHRQFGEAPTEEIVPIEQALSLALRSTGLEHRHTDALAVKSATVVANPVPPSPREVMAYLTGVILDSSAIQLIQDSQGGQIYMLFSPVVPAGLVEPLLRGFSSQLPPGVTVEPLPAEAPGTFALVYEAFGLKLWPHPVYLDGAKIKTWQTLVQSFKESAQAASKVYKGMDQPKIPFKIAKSADKVRELKEGIVTGVVLEPEMVDKTRHNPDGTPTGAAGDIYSEEEIEKAMYWWMENARHTETFLHNGRVIQEPGVVVLECFKARSDYMEGSQLIKKGSWVTTERVRDEELKTAIEKGEINSWSIGASAMGAFEEIEEDEA